MSAEQHSLKKRYFYKLFSSLGTFLFNLIMQAFIPRGLGPKAYGDFNFLTNFFNQFVGFLDSGSSTCLYTKLSQKQKDSGLLEFYFSFEAAVLLVVFSFLAIVLLAGIGPLLWPGQKNLYIFLAAGLGVLAWVIQVLSSVADARGLTVWLEIAKIFQKIIAFVIICFLFIFRKLDLRNLFLYNFLILIFLGLMVAHIINKKGYTLRFLHRLSAQETRDYISLFYRYCNPLFLFALTAFVVSIFDRWILQLYAGSAQQGFYSLSYQIGAICFLFTSAMAPLLMREFSVAYGEKDITKMAYLFRRYIPMLYSIAAYFSCFVAVHSEKIVYIFGGSSFGPAVMPVAIMAFYPIHQTYGQLSGSVFYATGQTALYRNIGMALLLLGLPITYFLIAPAARMGLNYGAVGLAIKMVIMNIIIVNTQLYFNAKQLNLRFWRYLGHQFFSVLLMFLLALITAIGADYLFNLKGRIIPSFITAGVLYTFLVLSAIYFFPVIFGVYKEDVTSALKVLARKLPL